MYGSDPDALCKSIVNIRERRDRLLTLRPADGTRSAMAGTCPLHNAAAVNIYDRSTPVYIALRASRLLKCSGTVLSSLVMARRLNFGIFGPVLRFDTHVMMIVR